MSAAEIKTDIRNMLKKVEDEKVLKAIHALVKEIAQDDAVGYEPNGKPITLAKLQLHLDQAEEDIQKGRVYTTAQAKQHFKTRLSLYSSRKA